MVLPRFSRRLGVLVAGLMCLTGARAGVLTDAEQELSASSPGPACEALTNFQPQSDEERRTSLFLLGRCYARAGQHAEAVDAFGELLKLVDTVRVRFELGKSLLQLGEKAEAEDNFQAVLQTQPPAQVREAIRQELKAAGYPEAAEEDSDPRQVSVQVGLGRSYDTNVNSGSATDTLLMFGIPFRIDDSSLPQKDWATLATLNAELKDARLPDWRVNVALQAVRHDTLSMYDSYVGTGELTRRFEREGYANELGVVYLTQFVEGTSQLASAQLRGRHEQALALGDATSTLGIGLQKQRAGAQVRLFELSQDLSGQWAASEAANHRWGWRIALDGRREDANAKLDSCLRLGAEAGLSGWHALPVALTEGPLSGWHLESSLNVRRGRDTWDAASPVFGVTRQDQLLSASASLGISSAGAAEHPQSLTLRLERSRNRSTVDMYSSGRTQATVSYGLSW